MNKVIDRRRSLDAQPDARRTTLFDYVTDLAGKTPTPEITNARLLFGSQFRSKHVPDEEGTPKQ